MIYIAWQMENLLYGFFVAFGHLLIDATMNLDFKKMENWYE